MIWKHAVTRHAGCISASGCAVAGLDVDARQWIIVPSIKRCTSEACISLCNINKHRCSLSLNIIGKTHARCTSLKVQGSSAINNNSNMYNTIPRHGFCNIWILHHYSASSSLHEFQNKKSKTHSFYIIKNNKPCFLNQLLSWLRSTCLADAKFGINLSNPSMASISNQCHVCLPCSCCCLDCLVWCVMTSDQN